MKKCFRFIFSINRKAILSCGAAISLAVFGLASGHTLAGSSPFDRGSSQNAASINGMLATGDIHEQFAGNEVRLVTFRSSITSRGYSMLQNAGFEIIEHLPNYSYLVYGDAASLNRLRHSAKSEGAAAKWLADHEPADLLAAGLLGGGLNKLNTAYLAISDSAFAARFLPDKVRNKTFALKNANEKIADGNALAKKETDDIAQRWARLKASLQTGDIIGARIKAASVSQVNFDAVAEQDRQKTPVGPTKGVAVPNPVAVEIGDESPTGEQNPYLEQGRLGRELKMPASDPPGPLVPSPPATANFLGQEDGPKVGTASFTIPPDTSGAVGADKIFSNTNQNYRVQDKVTGSALSTVNSDSFWATSGGTNFFDPRILYDPYSRRWIMAMDSDPRAAGSSIEIAVSQTSDPQGGYFIYRFVVGCAAGSAGCNAGGEWADFPMLGFNQNWIAVSMNMFSISGNASVNQKMVVLDYAAAKTGTATATVFSSTTIGFCNYPVHTFSSIEQTLYLAQHLVSAAATYKLSTITGTPANPVLTIGAPQTRTGGGWTQPSGDILPQTCVGTPGVTCPVGPLRFFESGDAQVRSSPVFRNGSIYYPQTIGLPAGGLTRTALQWTRLNTSGTFLEGGRIDDPTATSSNGGKWYAFSSMSVNANNDFLLGFSQFASNQFASAGYAYRHNTDAAGTTRDPLIYKAGEDYYSKTFSGTRNRWGDYSQTSVDPSNDLSLWTVQEYARPRTVPDANIVTNNSRWGTWWASLGIGATVSGRVLTIDNRGIRNALVYIIDPAGAVRTVATSSFGFYSFDDVVAGATYTIRVNSKRYRFSSQVVEVNGSLTDVNFVGLE